MSDIKLLGESKHALVNSLTRAKSAISAARHHTEQITGRAINTSITAGSGYLSGALRNHYGVGPDKKLLVPGTQLEADLAYGVLASLAGITGMAGKYSEQACASGAGVLAGHLAISALAGGFDFKSGSKY